MSGDRPARARREAREAEAALDKAVRGAFWQSLHHAPLPAMLALEIAARAIGALYRQVADAHQGPGACACGWRPDPDGDLIVLEANLAASLLRPRESDVAEPDVAATDLAEMSAAGRA